jgi:hypothetical protein
MTFSGRSKPPPKKATREAFNHALDSSHGYKHSLAHHPFEAPWFHGIYVASLLVGARARDPRQITTPGF